MRLTQKRLDASRRGGDARKQEKIDRVKKILSLSESQITPLSQKELWLMGIMLYWAEGSKEKDSKPGSGVSFSNSDPRMLKLFLSWLKGACQVTGDRIYYEIYLHESHRDSLKEVQKFWHDKLLVGNSHQVPVYFKKNKIKTLRKNIGSNYKGLIRIKVKKSSELQRQITGWINGVCKNSGVV